MLVALEDTTQESVKGGGESLSSNLRRHMKRGDVLDLLTQDASVAVIHS